MRCRFALMAVDVRCETEPACPDTTVADYTFTANINRVQRKLGGDDSHQLDPTDHISVLMARR